MSLSIAFCFLSFYLVSEKHTKSSNLSGHQKAVNDLSGYSVEEVYQRNKSHMDYKVWNTLIYVPDKYKFNFNTHFSDTTRTIVGHMRHMCVYFI